MGIRVLNTLHTGVVWIFLHVMKQPPSEQGSENAHVNKNFRKIVLSSAHPEKMQQRQTGYDVNRFMQSLPPLGTHGFDGAVE